MADVRTLVDSRLRETLGEPGARASVTFLGTERIEVLRFVDADAGTVRYATLGMSSAPMTDPAEVLADPERGPRAELLLTVRAGIADTDKVLRPLAVLAASPQVEGVVVAPGASLDTGEPLWPGAPFTSVLVAEPGGWWAWPGGTSRRSSGRAAGAGPLPAAAADDADRSRLEARPRCATRCRRGGCATGRTCATRLRGPVPLGD